MPKGVYERTPEMKIGIYKRTEGHKKKIGIGNKGKIVSEEAKRKISEATMGEKNHNWKGGDNRFPNCIDCGKKLSRIDAKRCQKCANRIRTFSLKLRQQSSEKWRGKKNPNWKGGITPLVEMIRDLPEYENWRIAVFKKDNYTCQECFKRGGNLHVHHNNKSFAIILNEFLNKYSQFSPFEDKETLIKLAIAYEPFWNLNNGKTLCENCHGRITMNEVVAEFLKKEAERELK